MTASTASRRGLDPVTFEVLRSAFVTIVDQMAEQILRTCHSFVMYSRDFSSGLCDAEGNTVAQGNQDLAAQVGTLHFTAKAVLDYFGDDIHPGDVFAINDPYRGGTHFSDVRIVRPVFVEGRLIGLAQSNGHWSDIGGSVPGSFDVSLRDYYGGGVRITPLRIVDRGEPRRDVIELLVSNTRAAEDTAGDLEAQTEATRVAERELTRLCERYGTDVVVDAMAETLDYVERLTRRRIASLPDGTWETVDHLDFDPDRDEGLLPVRVKMTIEGDHVHYDLSGSHPAIANLYNASYGGSFSGAVGGTKLFFPDIPLNSGFYRAVTCDAGPEGSVVNAVPPYSVSGMLMPYDRVMNAIVELWSHLVPERAMACSYCNEYLQVGGNDGRRSGSPFFMWYDWLVGGWGARNGRDGIGPGAGMFGPGLASQPVEGQERLSPVVVDEFVIQTDSGGPGRYRGGCGVRKAATLTAAEQTVLSYICERERSIVWGIEGGLPSLPQGLELEREPGGEAEYLGAHFSNVPVPPGARFSRPSAGGGGLGDPLQRDPGAVLEDVIDGYVSVERARVDYGVVIEAVDPEVDDYRVDDAATRRARAEISAWRGELIESDPEEVARRYREGELSMLDLVRQYGVIVDWGSGELLASSTRTYRDMLRNRSVAHWGPPGVTRA
jgi:N-methylhydantoinase B